MDLTFGKRTRAAEKPSLETMMLAWPDCFYKEREPLLRMALLREAEKQGLTPEENVIRRKLVEARYPGMKKAAMTSEDNYLKMWLYSSFAADTIKRGRLPRSSEKDIRKLHTELGIGDFHGEEELALLYKELYQMTLLYINLSLEDKRYGSILFGLGRMSDEKLAMKLAKDVYKVGHRVPEILKFENYEVWEKAVIDGYSDYFPDERGYLQSLIDGKEG